MTRRLHAALIAAVLATSLAGCAQAGSALPAFYPCAGPATKEDAVGSGGLDTAQRRVADGLIGVFEYERVEPRYDDWEVLGDGRGITAGRAGFTSGTGDLVEVVQAYVARAPDNALARYLPRLRELAQSGSPATTGLDGMEQAWRAAAADDRMRAAQDEINDVEYYLPAVHLARQNGVRTALGISILYDTAIQHGVGEDPDGLPALIAVTTREAHGSPATGVPEREWLSRLLRVREADLLGPHDQATAAGWAQSTGRVRVLRCLLAAQDFDLRPPVTANPWADRNFVIG